MKKDGYYQIIHNQKNNTIYAISTYAGKTVRGKAKCAPGDTYNAEKGADLAKARCNEKVAKLRMKRASKKVKEAEQALAAAQNYYNRMINYHNDSIVAFNDATYRTGKLESSM